MQKNKRKIVYRTIEGVEIPFVQYKDEYNNIIEERDPEIEALIRRAERLNCAHIVTYLIENDGIGNPIEDSVE